ncbi:MAG TPA: diguanylate cyclase, partial [Thermoanaerobaculia bacterium]|nr:diguanylate cyclase [Thermoanaerobaculia bacterium]
MSAADASLLFSLAVRGLVALSLAIALYVFHRRYPRNDLRRWALALVSLGAYWVAASSLLVLAPRLGVFHPLRIAIVLLTAAAGYLAPLLLAWGAWEIGLRKPVKIHDAKVLLLVWGAMAVATPLFLLALPNEVRFQIYLPVTLQGVVSGAAFAWSGHRIWRSRASVRSAGFALFSAAFLGYSMAQVGSAIAAFAFMARGRAFPSPTAAAAVDVFFLLVTGLGMMILVLEDEREAALEAASQVEHIAYHDPLTGLPNRALFLDRLIVALAHASRHQHKVGILFLDLDRFKQINDSLGHTMGDHLLKGAAERIRAAVREEDTIARFGGDEFALLIHILGRAEHAGKIARKILDALAAPFTLGTREIFITGSVGVAIYPNDGVDAETLIRNADTAMYRAKHQGGDAYQFYT